MSNLSSQFSGGPNPGLVAIAGIEKGLHTYEKYKRNKARLDRIKQRSSVYADATTLQQHTESNLPEQDKEPQMAEKNTAIHPWTGERVPRTPVKPKGKKPTAPGTKPKKKK